jgi:hypothetical protein
MVQTSGKKGENGIADISFNTLQINVQSVKNRDDKNIGKKENELLTQTHTIHEMGHTIDLLLFGDNKRYGTFVTRYNDQGVYNNLINQAKEEVPDMSPLMNALRNSDAIKKIDEVGQRRWRQHADYLLDPAEVFARAYTQYIVTKSGNEELKQTLLAKTSRDFGNGHWDEKEFNANILPEFDKLFRNRGLLR